MKDRKPVPTTPTPEQIARNISAAYDSLNLIDSVVLLQPDDNNKNTVTRNYKHLELMMSKEWFKGGLTNEQIDEINSAINKGKEYTK